jgi:DNA-directed RNA polymerase sigma subunit (sigma70/sigma32)
LLDELEWLGPSGRNRLVSVLAVRALLKKHGLADVSTTTARRRLMLTVLGRLAEFKRELIRARTGERREAIKRRDHGEETLAEIGRSYNVSGQTIAQMSSASKQHHS